MQVQYAACEVRCAVNVIHYTVCEIQHAVSNRRTRTAIQYAVSETQ